MQSRPGGGSLAAAGFAGALLAIFGLLCGLTYLALGALQAAGDPSLLGAAVAAGSTALLFAGLGVALYRGATAAGQGQAGRPFAPASPMPWLLGFFVVLLSGTGLLTLGFAPLTVLLFPALHLGAALLPAMVAIGQAARGSGEPVWLSWRGVLGRLAWGAGVATGLSIIGELVAGLFILLIVVVALGSSASGQATLDALAALAASAGEGGGLAPQSIEPSQIAELLHPAILLGLFLLLSLLGPVIEELAKLAGVVVRPARNRSQAWLWGVSVGAGFGILEGLLFGALDPSPLTWSFAALARGFSTLMHASMTGLAALGWYALTVERRKGTGLMGIGLAVLGHGLWNGLALGSVVLGLLDQPVLASLSALALILLFNLIFFGFLRAPSVDHDRLPPEA